MHQNKEAKNLKNKQTKNLKTFKTFFKEIHFKKGKIINFILKDMQRDIASIK